MAERNIIGGPPPPLPPPNNNNNNNNNNNHDDKQGFGVLIRTIQKGNGRNPKKGQTCRIRYEGRLETADTNNTTTTNSRNATGDNNNNSNNAVVGNKNTVSSRIISMGVVGDSDRNGNGNDDDSDNTHHHPVLVFVMGKHQVLEGIEAAVACMSVGQIAEVTIPHMYAYGPAGYPPMIPPKATLIYRIELLAIE